MAGKFKKGDVVRLKSGGPAMTSRGKANDYDNAVTWFDEKGIQQYGVFDDDELELDEEEEG